MTNTKHYETSPMVNEMEEQVIYVLPQIEDNGLLDDFVTYHKAYMANYELAKTIDYIPDSLETLMAIDYSQKKVLMRQNERFRNAALALCPDAIRILIKRDQIIAKDSYANGEISRSTFRKVQKATTIDEIVESGYYGDNHDNALHEVLNILVEDYL